MERIFTGPYKNQYAAKLLYKRLDVPYSKLLDRIEVLGGNFKDPIPYIKVEICLEETIPIVYKIELKEK